MFVGRLALVLYGAVVVSAKHVIPACHTLIDIGFESIKRDKSWPILLFRDIDKRLMTVTVPWCLTECDLNGELWLVEIRVFVFEEPEENRGGRGWVNQQAILESTKERSDRLLVCRIEDQLWESGTIFHVQVHCFGILPVEIATDN